MSEQDKQLAVHYLSVKEYAFAKGVTAVTVRRWIAQGWLPAERKGVRGNFRIRDCDEMYRDVAAQNPPTSSTL